MLENKWKMTFPETVTKQSFHSKTWGKWDRQELVLQIADYDRIVCDSQIAAV